MNPTQGTQEVIRSLLCVVFLMIAPALASDINTCRYLVVKDFTSDPYGLAKELRSQAEARGFSVVAEVPDASSLEAFKTCVMAGSWSVQGASGDVAVRVQDAASGRIIGEAATSATNWWSVSRTVRGAVDRIYKQLGYTGYDETLFQQKITREFPSRPKLSVSEEEIRSREPRNAVEGIWSDPEDKYRLGVVAAPLGTGADFVAVILRSSVPVWQPGEIKAEIRTTASPMAFTCTYYMANKKPAGTTLSLENALLRGSITTPAGSPYDIQLMRVWPKMSAENASTQTEGATQGTAFLLNRNGVFVTNWHVIDGRKHIAVALPGWHESANAEVIIRDATNDIALLRVTDTSRLASTCSDLPFQLAAESKPSLGQRVTTVGYPLAAILGSTPRFAEGAVSGTTGIRDDPRWLQISAQVEPGSSGSPLFDTDGNVIGIVVARLDDAKAVQMSSAIPQNVNFAIKADYLRNLVGMLPAESAGTRTTTFSPDKAAQCIALVTAW